MVIEWKWIKSSSPIVARLVVSLLWGLCMWRDFRKTTTGERRAKKIYDHAFQSNQMEKKGHSRRMTGDAKADFHSLGPFTHPIQIGKLDTIGARGEERKAVKRTIFMMRVKWSADGARSGCEEGERAPALQCESESRGKSMWKNGKWEIGTPSMIIDYWMAVHDTKAINQSPHDPLCDYHGAFEPVSTLNLPHRTTHAVPSYRCVYTSRWCVCVHVKNYFLLCQRLRNKKSFSCSCKQMGWVREFRMLEGIEGR